MDITGTDGLYYIGHSMGTTMFFICMAERPEYNSKIKIMSALAPVAHTEHMISPIALIAPFSGEIQVNPFEFFVKRCNLQGTYFVLYTYITYITNLYGILVASKNVGAA